MPTDKHHKKILSLTKSMPKIGTKAYIDYITNWKDIGSFLKFIIYMTSHIDKTAEIAHSALVSYYKYDKAEKSELINKFSNRKTMVDHLRDHKQFLMETLHIRLVDNFLNYLSSLLFEIFTKKPHTMKSKELIDYETIIESDSINSLVRALAEIKTTKLTYKSYLDVCQYMNCTFGIQVSENHSVDISYAIELRNLIVHNRCTIDKKFISRTKINKNKHGARHEMHIGLYEKYELIFLEKVIEIDLLARKHLKLTSHFTEKKRKQVSKTNPATT